MEWSKITENLKKYDPLNYSLKFKLHRSVVNWTTFIFILILIPYMALGGYVFLKMQQNDELVKNFLKINPEYEMLYYQKRNLLQDEINFLHESIAFKNSVTVYALIDNKMKVTSQSKYIASIIANVGHQNSYKNKRYWQKQAIPKGYVNFNDKVLNSNDSTFFWKDVRLDEDVYNGKTKLDIDYNNTSSIYVVFLFKKEGVKYLLSVTYDNNNINSLTYVKSKINNVKSDIIKILEL